MVRIIRLAPEDQALFAPATELIRRTQGETSCPDWHVANYAGYPAACVAVAALDGDRLVGIATGGGPVPDPSVFLKLCPEERREGFAGRKIAQLVFNSVDPGYQGQGIGRRLTEERLRFVAEKGCDYAFALSWANGATHTSGNVFERLGFERIAVHESFYRDAIANLGVSCPVCGKSCSCRMILYGIELNGSSPRRV